MLHTRRHTVISQQLISLLVLAHHPGGYWEHNMNFLPGQPGHYQVCLMSLSPLITEKNAYGIGYYKEEMR